MISNMIYSGTETGTRLDQPTNGLGWKRPLVLVAASIFALGAPLALIACNTTEGVGEDISATGDAIDRAAEDASN